jgi:glutamate synthase (NADPH/NADH) small chain
MKVKKGFLEVKRKNTSYRAIPERVKDYREVALLRNEKETARQASRCMDCGTPFCNWACPLGNYIPEWNDEVLNGNWKQAFELLNMTNNLPEITGRICPALCEYSCVLGLNDDAVTIRENELAIIEHAFKKGWLKPQKPKKRTNKKVAVVGSGPAGLACAMQLNKAGHAVTIFEKDKKAGGILRYGIPDFKLEKKILDRRLDILEKEGIIIKTSVNAGVDIKSQILLKDFDAICLTGGSRIPRDIKIEGRDLKGICFAMDFLTQSNRAVTGEKYTYNNDFWAKDKKVIVIGGGDTGADCMGVAHRQGAKSVIQLEIMSKPPKCRTHKYPWPYYPLLYKMTTSHEEGGERYFSVMTKKFVGKYGFVNKLSCIKLDFKEDSRGCSVMSEIKGSEFEIDADLVIIAAGFLHPEHRGLIHDFKIKLDERGNVKTDNNFMTSKKNVFAAGDLRRGQSLIVWAISEGRKAAFCIDKYLMKKSNLPYI